MKQKASNDKLNKWLDVGYELFGLYGPDDFNVEKLASIVGQNKSGFYYYFLDRESYFMKLLKYHEQEGIRFANELAEMENFLPDFIHIIMRFQVGVQVQLQLRNHQHIPYYRQCYLNVKKLSDNAHLPHWSRYLKIDNMSLALELFDLATDTIIARMKSNHLNYNFLLGVYEGMRQTIERLRGTIK